MFQEIFRRRGIEITQRQARGPMGMAKRDHIAAIARNARCRRRRGIAPRIGQPCSEADIDALYRDFLPLQKSTFAEHCDMIAGVADSRRAHCRPLGLKIGSSTGYTRELMDDRRRLGRTAGLRAGLRRLRRRCAARTSGPVPDLSSGDTARRLSADARSSIVDDTPVGIDAGRNAGCWTVGVTRTGNCLGLSLDELQALGASEVEQRCDNAAAVLERAGAHYTLESVADLVPLIERIDERAAPRRNPRLIPSPSSVRRHT